MILWWEPLKVSPCEPLWFCIEYFLLRVWPHLYWSKQTIHESKVHVLPRFRGKKLPRAKKAVKAEDKRARRTEEENKHGVERKKHLVLETLPELWERERRFEWGSLGTESYSEAWHLQVLHSILSHQIQPAIFPTSLPCKWSPIM